MDEDAPSAEHSATELKPGRTSLSRTSCCSEGITPLTSGRSPLRRLHGWNGSTRLTGLPIPPELIEANTARNVALRLKSANNEEKNDEMEEHEDPQLDCRRCLPTQRCRQAQEQGTPRLWQGPGTPPPEA